MALFDIVFPVQTEVLTTVTKERDLTVKAHSVKFQNDGNTVALLKGLEPIHPQEFLIIGHYGDFRAFVSDTYAISFEDKGITDPVNKLRVFVELVKDFPYR